LHELYKRARRGDTQAEKLLFDRLRVSFLIIAKRKIGEAEAEDLAQDACVTIFEKYRELPESFHFGPWAYTVLKNKIGNYLQRIATRKKAESQGLVTDLKQAHPPGDSYSDVRQSVRQCMVRLVKAFPRYARIINLHHQGYTSQEICLKMGISRNHLHVMLHRGRKLLLDCVNEKESHT